MLYYQPKICARAGVISGAEALLRWHHPILGEIGPAEFIPLAEKTDLISEIGYWVIRTACRQLASWDHAGITLRTVAVNLSPKQLLDRSLPAFISNELLSQGLSPDRLEIEITENEIVKETNLAVETLEALRRIGIKLCIDDFGIGFASLTRLRRFPFDAIKIDRSFVCNLVECEWERKLTQAIVTLGKSLQLLVVAEGVETKEQEEFLITFGCDELQGFRYSKAISPDAFANILSPQQ